MWLNIYLLPAGPLHLSKYTLTWGQLEHYSWLCVRWGETLNHAQALQHYLDDVIDLLTDYQQSKALNLRAVLIESITTGKPYDIVKAKNTG